jgi:hypothetical protein
VRRVIARGQLTWLVGGLALAMTAGVVAEAWPVGSDHAVSDEKSAEMLPTVASTAPDALPIDDWVADALGRPLFAADRRPDAVVAVPEEALPRLAGTIRLTNTALAIFQPVSSDNTAKTLILGEGADLSGWTITDIASDGVTLMRDGHIASLRLSYANLPAAPRHLGLVPIRVLHDKRTSPFLQP